MKTGSEIKTTVSQVILDLSLLKNLRLITMLYKQSWYQNKKDWRTNYFIAMWIKE